MGTQHEHQRVLAITPFAQPSARLAAALAAAGARSVLDLGRDRARATAALRDLGTWWSGEFGVRVGAACPVMPEELPEKVRLVVLTGDARWSIAAATASGREVVVEVGSAAQACAAVEAGAHALIVRGSESGGLVGEAGTFVLLQEVLGAELGVPVWASGGIGPHTAAAAVAGGAVGVVLDAQLGLVEESELPGDVVATLRRTDGTETAVIGGRRIHVRPDLPRPAADGIELILGGDSLAALPLGEDGALARPLAERHRTAAGVVAAVAAGISGGLRAAVANLAPGRPCPRVAQGPMTRVSDQAAFAAAVAAEDGLPFIALALMGGEDARALLVETAERLGDAPWGVGILGFVPDEIRAAQLEAVHEVRPPYALIAGGRPAQARPLEAAGITTFLHVPSPALLERFLAEGARRFVFEGSECGGHVGPRAAFPLWEQQIQRLVDFGAKHGCAAELDVLFAGGIHDARSAAMVAAAAAPLVAAGGAAGLLMGTAYLFTREAVTTGAIVPAFQRAAVACDRTVLLATAPGHATRCADGTFVATFNATREARLTAGVPAEQVWAELEQLNIGRLRIASKGIRREGAALIPVDERTQARDGMVMIGDLARLRSSVTTIADLHATVTSGAATFLTERAAALTAEARPGPAQAPLDVAIVGMAGVFPQAGDLAEFWSNVLRNHDAITEVPADRWDPATYFTGDGATLDGPARNGRSGTPSKWGGFLPDIPFDALRYGIPPAALASIEPVQLLSLEVAARALRDAGYESAPAGPPGGARAFDRERTAVVFGAEPGTDLSAAYGFRALYPQLHGELPAALDDQLPQLTGDSFPGVLANVISGRIANRLDLGGANYTVDAACASALAALEVACLQLRSGAADMVLAGGADIHNGIQDYLLFASVGALSPTGHCKPFDATADGIALGEGVACLVLKRLADAQRDGDRIYAVVAGVGSASDGRSLGLTAPRPEGQRRAIERAYAQAGINPAEVGLVEAHGTGTVVGDRTELAVLTDVFGSSGAPVGGCMLGSVKSQIGHTKCTAGLAGLIKATFAIHTGVLPPTGKITAPNPAWDPANSPFVFCDTPRPWRAGRRVAGISAFGFGGTNFHAVLTGWTGTPAPRHGLDQWPVELFAFGGSTDTDALAQVDRLRILCEANDGAGRPWRLRDLARTTAEQSSDTTRFAVVAADLDDLAGKLAALRKGRATDGVFVATAVPDGVGVAQGGEVALLFPGQGSQRPGMLAELFAAFPRLGDLLELAAPWTARIYPPSAFDEAGRAAAVAALKDTRVAQPALGLAGLAMHRTLTALGVAPAHLAGHSYGELVALTAAGALEPDELLELSAARGRAIMAAAGDDPGTMAAVAASADDVRAALNGTPVVIANINSPVQTVISGPTPAIAEAVSVLAAAGLRAAPIPVACAFHSPVVADAARGLEAELATRTVGSPHLPVWSNATAAPYPLGGGRVREMLAEQVVSPVRFADQIEAMYAAGARIFVECGPGGVLTGLVRSILGKRPHLAVTTDVEGRHSLHSLLTALARLAVAGVPVDTAPLFAGRDAELVSATQVPARPGWSVNGHLVRTTTGEPVRGGLRPAVRVAPVGPTVVAAHAVVLPEPAVAEGPAGAAAVVLEFLRGTRELLATQREVVLGYLAAGSPAGAAPLPRPTRPIEAIVRPAVEPEPAQPATPATQTTPKADVLAVLTELISERTGYPVAMLDADLDLEADLSIGSLKRTEIVALLADRLREDGLDCAPDESRQAELTRIRTLRGIVQALSDASGAPAARPVGPLLPTQAGPADAAAYARVATLLTELISERTGYPVAMLDADLDLEADLSIGSLKRTEIVALLADRLRDTGLNCAPDESRQAELTRIRTLRGIVEALTGRPVAPSIPAPAVAPVPAPTVPAPTVPAPSRPRPAPASAASPTAATPKARTAPHSAGGGELTPDQISAMLVELIGDRTGYPAAMIDADLDLEADLSIGSLKRTEIVGLLADRLSGSIVLDETLQAELTRLRNVRAMVAHIERHRTVAAVSTPAGLASAIDPETPEPTPARPALRRYLLEPRALPAALDDADLRGRHITLVAGSSGAAIELGSTLEACGATVRTVSTDPDTELGDVDILVHLGAAGPSEPPSLPESFAVIRRAVLGGARQLLVATGHGGRFSHRSSGEPAIRNELPAGLGLAGLVRTIAREYPDISCRCLDLDPKESPTVLARHLLAELRSPTGPELVGYVDGTRVSLALVEAPLDPAPAGRPAAVALGLTESSVVLLTGGARGITARVALGLARETGCHVVLWGRNPLPAPQEDPITADAPDAAALRKALITAGIGAPAAIERRVRATQAEREIRASLAALRGLAASVEYRSVDVRDSHAVAEALADLRVRHGRVDGVIHGAGILDDRLIADKTAEGFARVWETKVDGARALATNLDADLRFLVLFGSVSGVFGNRGQCDYAAANDALDTLARAWESRFTGRVLSVDWGPWMPTGDSTDGMVSPELLRSYARAGVAALHPDDGVRALLTELADGTAPQVVYVCAEPSAFEAAFSAG
ncbi:MAG TPA: SDR family NAD(P)-dependent oxidoreductase [Sporichthyaceae bacterium]|jgi:acyl transferase domain-containing protein/NAD(P)H-dependent flavin oxidoreductase YrpB (nitropropane dioxygenase family)/NADP-dependent 3-hydroxy acid dehydrogenase YdfG/acyl carrier protein|nr:SDR family NAD(P)-dependent oxidoreductase [Sporichthyaceae bacterium]